MSNEAQVRISLSVRKGSINHRPPARVFNVTVTGSKGPTPAAIAVPLGGVAVDLSQLVTPGLCQITNLDPAGTDNYVEIGIRFPASSLFFPMLELAPGESYVLKLSRNLLEDYASPGTGTSGEVNQLWILPFRAAAVVLVEAFER